MEAPVLSLEVARDGFVEGSEFFDCALGASPCLVLDGSGFAPAELLVNGPGELELFTASQVAAFTLGTAIDRHGLHVERPGGCEVPPCGHLGPALKVARVNG
jgi:hypothetical protein